MPRALGVSNPALRGHCDRSCSLGGTRVPHGGCFLGLLAKQSLKMLHGPLQISSKSCNGSPSHRRSFRIQAGKKLTSRLYRR